MASNQVAGLRQAVADPLAPCHHRWEAGRLLGTMGEEHQDFAARALTAAACPMVCASYAAGVLAGFALRNQVPYARRLRATAADHGRPVEERIWAADALVILGGSHREEGLWALLALLAEPCPGVGEYQRTYGRWMAAELLASRFPEHCPLAAAAIRSGNITVREPENELRRASALGGLGGAYATEAARILADVSARYAGDDRVRAEVAVRAVELESLDQGVDTAAADELVGH
jgi:hypothetical protein